MTKIKAYVAGIVAFVICPCHLPLTLPLLILAAFSGDNTNYWIGRLVGMKLLKRTNGLIKRYLAH